MSFAVLVTEKTIDRCVVTRALACAHSSWADRRKRQRCQAFDQKAPRLLEPLCDNR